MANEIKRLLPRHYAILDLVLLGHGPKEVADQLGISSASAGMVISSPLFQDELARRRESRNKDTDRIAFDGKLRAKQLVEQCAVRAVEVHEELLENPDPSIRQRSATDILKLAYSDEAKNNRNAGNVVIVQGASLETLVAALSEAGLGNLLSQREETVKRVDCEVLTGEETGNSSQQS